MSPNTFKDEKEWRRKRKECPQSKLACFSFSPVLSHSNCCSFSLGHILDKSPVLTKIIGASLERITKKLWQKE